MQVKSIAECSKHSAILLTFIKLPFVIKTFVLSISEWSLKKGFTVLRYMQVSSPRGEKDVADSGAQSVSAESLAGDVDDYELNRDM